jgi:elongation factor 1-alpha
MAKPMINLVFAGHVDHGKSTLVGRLFYELGMISEHEMKRLERHASALGKESFKYAFFTDESLEERQRGISIEVSFKGFETKKKQFNIIDAPGHKDFIKNMITGASMGDVGILIVDANTTYEKGIQAQTREHLLLLYNLGMEQVLIVLNKMDTANYSKNVYEGAKQQLTSLIEEIGAKLRPNSNFIPTSALYGENITEPSGKMSWYNGPTFIEALDLLQEPQRLEDKPLRMPILRTFRAISAGTVIAGKVESGTINTADTVVIVPYPGKGKISGEVRSIEWQHKRIDKAGPGEDVGILLGRLEKGFVARQIKKGYMVGDVNNPPVEVEKFKANLIVLDHPSSIRKGYSPSLHCHQAALPCSIIEIEKSFNPRTGEIKEENPERLVKGDSAVVWIKPQKPFVIEEINKIPKLSRFILREGITVAAGICLEALPKSKGD